MNDTSSRRRKDLAPLIEPALALPPREGARRLMDVLHQLGRLTFMVDVHGPELEAQWTSFVGDLETGPARVSIEYTPRTFRELPIPSTVEDATFSVMEGDRLVFPRRKLDRTLACAVVWQHWVDSQIVRAQRDLSDEDQVAVLAEPVADALATRWDSDEAVLQASRSAMLDAEPQLRLPLARLYPYAEPPDAFVAPRAHRRAFEYADLVVVGRRLELIAAWRELDQLIALARA
jgi:hypothetical protein